MPGMMAKTIRILFILFCLAVIITFSIFFSYWFSWHKRSETYLKETALYFNSLVKFSSQYRKFEEIGKLTSYTLYPIRVLDRKGNLIGNIRTNNKIIVPFDKIGKPFLNALIATEDQSFYDHNGVSFTGILRAFLNNISEMKFSEGGSTITQQLSKLLLTNQERTLRRKMNEFFTALSIEKNYTKNDILFMYSNLVYFGYNIYGVGLAAKAYFGKNINELSIAETSLLVALISNPSFYNPYKHPENTKKKHLAVLIHMYENGYLTKSEVIRYYRKFWEHPTLLPKISIPSSIFLGKDNLYVLEEVRRFLSNTYGNNYLDKLEGATVYTTIDGDIQKHIDSHIENFVQKIREESSLNYQDSRFIQSANIVSESKTGEILAFSGGVKYSNSDQFNRAFQAKRQVGSTIKPFLYAIGLDLHKITPYTVFKDTPIEVQFQNNVNWDVNNYAQSYRGYLNVSEALKRSSNVVAVQATNIIGLENIRVFFKESLNLGVQESQDIFSNYQYSVALGAINLTPLQLNQLYQILANNGVERELFFISRIEDISGELVYKHRDEAKVLFSRESAYLIKKMMVNVMSPGGSGNFIERHFNFQSEIAGKSGTTQNNRDVWFSGFSNKIVVTTWVGQDHNKGMGENFLGGIQAGTIFGDIMQYCEQLYPSGKIIFNKKDHLVNSPVDILTGYLPTPVSLFVKKGLFIEGTQPKKSVYLSISEQIRIAKEKRILTPQKMKEISLIQQP